jgi:hypothetical protein
MKPAGVEPKDIKLREGKYENPENYPGDIFTACGCIPAGGHQHAFLDQHHPHPAGWIARRCSRTVAGAEKQKKLIAVLLQIETPQSNPMEPRWVCLLCSRRSREAFIAKI